ncbi:FUN14 domain-containing protein 2 isoform 2-T2 [Morphnus guianensis]
MHGRSRSTPTRVPELTPRAPPLRARPPPSALLLPMTRRGRGGARPREAAVARLRLCSLVTCPRRRRREPSGAMAVPGGGVKEDSFNVLDLAEYTKNRPWWRKVFAPSSGSSAEKYSVATQLVIGGVTGWCTGFIFQKVGKLAATAVGGGFFLLQVIIFLKKNIILTGGFAGGFLLGMAS